MGVGFLSATTLLNRIDERLTDQDGATNTVRDYMAGDRHALAAMYDDFEPKRVAQGLPPNGAPRIKHWLDRVLRSGRHLVIEIDGRVRGHIMLMPHEPGTAELANFLHQSIRSRGIGTAVNQVALRLAKEEGYTRAWLSVEPGNKPAMRSYEKVGFRTRPGSFWSPEIEMTVEL